MSWWSVLCGAQGRAGRGHSAARQLRTRPWVSEAPQNAAGSWWPSTGVPATNPPGRTCGRHVGSLIKRPPPLRSFCVLQFPTRTGTAEGGRPTTRPILIVTLRRFAPILFVTRARVLIETSRRHAQRRARGLPICSAQMRSLRAWPIVLAWIKQSHIPAPHRWGSSSPRPHPGQCRVRPLYGAISLLWVVLAVLSFPLGTENHSGNCSHVNSGWVGQISVLSD